MRNINIALLLTFSVFISLALTSCKEMSTQKKHNYTFNNHFKDINIEDINKYRNAISNTIYVKFSSDNVTAKATEIKTLFDKQVKGLDPENCSISESSANLRAYFDNSEVDKVLSFLLKDPDITSLNKNTNDIGSSYEDYMKSLYGYQLLANNFDKVMNVIDTNNSYPVDSYTLKKIIEEQMNNYKSNIDSYKKQIGRTYIQIYVYKKN